MHLINLHIVHFLQGFPAWLVTLVIAALPIIELRGAIPIAITVLKVSVPEAFLLSVIGSLIPVFPILWGVKWTTQIAHRFPKLGRFLDWLFAHTRAKSAKLEKYEFWGLVAFVAIPLPGMGVWTGAVVGYLFGFSNRKTFLACVIGTVIAAVLVTAATLGVFSFF